MTRLYDKGEKNRKLEDDEAIEWLLNDYDDKLTAWEVDFLESLQGRLFFTDKQRAVLNDIWDNVMNKRGGGRGR